MAHLNKAEREKQSMLRQQKEQAVAMVLQFSRKRFKKFEDIIFALYQGEDLSTHFSDRRIWKIYDCFQKLGSKAKSRDKEIFKDMLEHLNGSAKVALDEAFIQAAYNMLLFRAHWRKDVFTWKARSKQTSAQMMELAEYLFCLYTVPTFLYKAFYECTNLLYIEWFLHIGSGKKVKEIGKVPIPFTQKMAHYFLQVPFKYSVVEALRWAQVKGLGGDDKLAERIAFSWIATKPYNDEYFWNEFLLLLVNSGMFNHDKLIELIDYVREAKREHAAYSLKGRTLQSLSRHSDEWHNRFAIYKGNQAWKPCGIEGYKDDRKKEKVVLQELTEAAMLREEGKTMKHCVASYAFYCAKGKTAIYSLRKVSGGILVETLATIEVNLSLRRIVQAKAKMNKPISEEAKHYLYEWADLQQLSLNPYL